MSVATITPAATKPAAAARKGRALTADDKAALAATMAKAVDTIRAEWAAVEISDVKAETVWAAAVIAKDNVRVDRCRIAYRAAMLTPVDGEPNLTRAAIILKSADYGNAAADRKAKDAKKSVEAYVKAGAALAKEGHAESVQAPTETEREIVAAAFKAHNNLEAKAKAAATKAAKEAAAAAAAAEAAKGPGRADTTEGADKADADALTFAAVLAQLAKAHATADLLIKAGGVVTDSDMETLATVMEALTVKLATQIG